jgi:hypothetical protein
VNRLAQSPIAVAVVVLIWSLVAVLAYLLLNSPAPARSPFEPSAPLLDAGPAAPVKPAPTAPASSAPTAPAGGPTAAPPATFRVANTGGDGVFLRRTPALADRLVAWPDGTRLQSLDEPATGDGIEWQKVRDPRGNVGYVPSRYLAREPPAPTP